MLRARGAIKIRKIAMPPRNVSASGLTPLNAICINLRAEFFSRTWGEVVFFGVSKPRDFNSNCAAVCACSVRFLPIINFVSSSSVRDLKWAFQWVLDLLMVFIV